MAGAQLGSALTQIHRLFDEGTLAGLPDARLLERYASERDELAFETLVKRHGRMVMAVCRAIVDDPNDADDAFQAAFLLLARKAGALWVDDSLGGWLHRVACRIALQVRSDAARRREVERRGAERTGWWYLTAEPFADLHTVLHEEIDRLPERFRKPIVLCYLEEMTYQQAASHLRLSEGTTRGRLARARDMLRARLNERGIPCAGIGLPVLSVSGRLPAPLPELLTSTIRASASFHARQQGRYRNRACHGDDARQASDANDDAHQAESSRSGSDCDWIADVRRHRSCRGGACSAAGSNGVRCRDFAPAVAAGGRRTETERHAKPPRHRPAIKLPG